MTADHFEAAAKTFKMLVPVFDEAQTVLQCETEHSDEPWNQQHPSHIDVSHIVALQAQHYEYVNAAAQTRSDTLRTVTRGAEIESGQS